MTDEELIARLRDWVEIDGGKINDARAEAADRIEALIADFNDCNSERLRWKKERDAATAAAYESAAKVAMEHCYAIMSATDADARAATIAVAIRALPAVAVSQSVRVKPLVWKAYDDKRDGRTHYGYGAFAHWYAVYRMKTGAWSVFHFINGNRTEVHSEDKVIYPTIEAAKATAQADYEARILAAIERTKE